MQLDGNGFRMPVKQQPIGAPVPRPAASVRVLFDGIPSPHVEVISTAIIRCQTPAHPPDRERNGQVLTVGTVNVKAQNLDDDGNVIEEVEVVNAFTFARPVLGGANVSGAWARVSEAFIEHWRNILLENTHMNPSVDYDPDTGDMVGFVKFAELPGIAITRISFPDSDSEPEGGPALIEATEEVLLEKRPPMASDVQFTLIIVSNNQRELLNLCEAVKTCFRDASIFSVQVDPNDESRGYAEFSMVQIGALALTERLGNTDIMTAEVPGVIFRVLSLDLPGAPEEGLPGMPEMPHQGTRARVPRLDKLTVRGGRPR